MADLKKAFDKEPKSKRAILISAVIAFAATFFPWTGVSFGTLGSASVNGWHSYGLLTALGSLALVLVWLLPKLGVKFKLPAKEKQIDQIISIIILVGPILWIISSNFAFEFIKVGLYIALGAGISAVYFSFKAKRKSTTSHKSS